MGRMKDLAIAREEWAKEVADKLNEKVEIIEVKDTPEWWLVRLPDGVLVSRIDDIEYVEIENEINIISEPIEVSPKDPQERSAAVERIRGLMQTLKDKENK